jgi:amino acid transporter
MIDSKRLTPTPAVIFTAAISLLMTAFSNIYQLLDFFNFLIWIFYGLDIVALFILRKRVEIDNTSKNVYRLKVNKKVFVKN